MFGHHVAGLASAVGHEMAKQAGGARKDAGKRMATLRR